MEFVRFIYFFHRTDSTRNSGSSLLINPRKDTINCRYDMMHSCLTQVLITSTISFTILPLAPYRHSALPSHYMALLALSSIIPHTICHRDLCITSHPNTANPPPAALLLTHCSCLPATFFVSHVFQVKPQPLSRQWCRSAWGYTAHIFL